MDTSVFTYVIDYNCIENAVHQANDCYIALRGLPNNKRFYVEVVNFMINTESLNAGAGVVPTYLTLTADDFCETGFMTYSRLDVLCQFKTADGGLKMNGNCFEVANFNGKNIHFQLVAPAGTVIPLVDIDQNGFITTWQLTLRMKPIQ